MLDDSQYKLNKLVGEKGVDDTAAAAVAAPIQQKPKTAF